MSAPGDQRTSAPAHATGAVEFVPIEEIAPDERFRVRPDDEVSELAQSMGRLGQLVPIDLRPWPGAATDGPRWQVVSGFRRLAAARLLARERILARIHRDLSDDDAWSLALAEALLREPLTGDELEPLRARLEQEGPAWAQDLIDDALVRAPLTPALRERFFEFLQHVAEPPPPAGSARPPSAEAPAAPTADVAAAPEPPPAPAPEETGAAPAAAEASPAAEGSTAAASPAGAEAAAPGERPTPPAPSVEVTPDELLRDLLARLTQLNHDLAAAYEAWDDLPSDGRAQLVEGMRWTVELIPYLEAKR